MTTRLRDAEPTELDRLARSLMAASAVDSREELAAIQRADPWRIQVNARGDVAFLDTWRDHLSYLSIQALWCPVARIGPALGQIRRLAEGRGFTDVVSPPVPVEDMHPYQAAGMHPHTVVATYQLDGSSPVETTALPEGLTLRIADAGDGIALLGVDARCFDAFWHYDARHLASFFGSSRLALVERDGAVLGYTLCTVDRGEGLLGRLCVVPEWRRRGVGSALLHDAVRWVRDQGGEHVMLSTQTDNDRSQALYRGANFHDTGRRYAFLRFGTSRG